MAEVDSKIIDYLFLVLFGLISVNLLINVSLYFVSKIKNIKMLCWYWCALLATFIIQGQFQDGEMGIMLSFGVTLVPDLIISKIMSDSLERKFPLKRYLTFWALGGILSYVLMSSGQSFRVSAMPLSLSLFYILALPGFGALIKYRQVTSLHQKFIGLIFIFGAIHSINFALYRMEPGTQLWGWIVSLGFYQVLSITLFAFAFEDYSRKEKERLKDLVAQRTEELTRTLQVKDTLFKAVLHDIANPITGQLWIMQQVEQGKTLTQDWQKRLFRLTNMVKDVIAKVRSIEAMNEGVLNIEMGPVNLEHCLEDVRTIFEGALSEKGLALEIQNNIAPGTTIMADRHALTTSVLSNLISNAIKFSPRNSTLTIRTFLRGGKIAVEVEDKGIGMPKDLAQELFDPTKRRSRLGTNGERGTGYGMPQVKSFVDYFGGSIDVESRSQEDFPMNSGTKITVTLDQTLSH